jgi:hypothetical protein
LEVWNARHPGGRSSLLFQTSRLFKMLLFLAD